MTGPGRTVVLRTGSLGDVVLSAVVTRALGPVTYVTHRRWVELARRLPGVHEVVGWPDDPLPRGVHRVVDLQGDLRARVLTARMAPQSAVHVRRYDWTRRARVWWKGPPAPRVVERYVAAAGVPLPPRPWLTRRPAGEHVAFVPGARWTTKRWPARYWVELAGRWAGPVALLGGPDEGAVLHELAREMGPRSRVVVESGFERTWAEIGSARAVVAGDTGLMHLAGAMGVPLVALFGPTTSEDGFWCHDGVVVERAMACRPCSRHGSVRCPKVHHACMEELDVAQVYAALQRVMHE